MRCGGGEWVRWGVGMGIFKRAGDPEGGGRRGHFSAIEARGRRVNGNLVRCAAAELPVGVVDEHLRGCADEDRREWLLWFGEMKTGCRGA